MNKLEFTKIIKEVVSQSAIDDTLETLNDPPGRNPDKKLLVQSEWFKGLNGPFEFKRIEWLELPNRIGHKPYENAPTQFKTQDLSRIIEQLNVIGSFEIDSDSESITIYGYKP
ncbi:hypothetical protein [Moritella sp.]|uniref:hypothetical protein n=1 Tax=Moritella sp. TaxID=78556 RepID=UPI001DDC13D8|nr:hypothetical protein [Moritella sp.]MCJ8349912.1 hypothetical protein [Moritella sp.]NQZ39796.1 hypothetical protein [Moritella sp.]